MTYITAQARQISKEKINVVTLAGTLAGTLSLLSIPPLLPRDLLLPPSFILSRRSLSIICIQAKPKRRSPSIGLDSHDGPECGAHAFVSVAVCACPNSSSCRTCQRGFCCWIDPDSISLSLSFSSTSPANQMGENNKKKKKRKPRVLIFFLQFQNSKFPTNFRPDFKNTQLYHRHCARYKLVEFGIFEQIPRERGLHTFEIKEKKNIFG